MTESDQDDKNKNKTRIRKPLPKSKKLNNSQVMKNTPGGVGEQPSQVYCPTPQQPTYTINTHLPFC